jgi:hypothetical protein
MALAMAAELKPWEVSTSDRDGVKVSVIPHVGCHLPCFSPHHTLARAKKKHPTARCCRQVCSTCVVGRGVGPLGPTGEFKPTILLLACMRRSGGLACWPRRFRTVTSLHSPQLALARQRAKKKKKKMREEGARVTDERAHTLAADCR